MFMSITLGNLIFLQAKEHPELMTASVHAALSSLPGSEKVGVAEIDPQVSDTATFCERYELNSAQAANCVVIEARQGESKQLVACVILATTRADINNVAKKALGAKKASFASMEAAVEKSAMEYGAITPVGLPPSWPILIDAAVAASDYVVVGSGVRKSKLAVPGNFLAALPNVQIVEGLGKARE